MFMCTRERVDMTVVKIQNLNLYNVVKVGFYYSNVCYTQGRHDTQFLLIGTYLYNI